MKRLFGLWVFFRNNLQIYPAAGVSAVFFAGMIFWGGFNWGLELTNTEAFCISCHEMREYLYKEYRKTVHYNNRTGVRASCPDCHVPKEWVYKFARKMQASNELFHWLKGSIRAQPDFEAKRPELAQRVWVSMAATDSRECRNCHDIGFMNPQIQTAGAQIMHGLAEEWGKTCIDCHKGIAHNLPRNYDENVLQDELHELMESEKIDCRICHKGMAGPPSGEAW